MTDQVEEVTAKPQVKPGRLWRIFPLSILAKCREWLRDLDQLRLRRMHKFH